MTAEQIAAARAKSEAYVLRNHPDSHLALRHIVNPIYPEELKSRNFGGSATLRCQVDRDGNVSSVEVVAATQPAFGQAAVEAVRQWKFTPAVKDHHYVAETADLPITFNPPKPAPAADTGATH
jgi:protein TonB